MRERSPPAAGWKVRPLIPSLVFTALVTALTVGCDPSAPVQKAAPPQPKSLFKEIPMGKQKLSR